MGVERILRVIRLGLRLSTLATLVAFIWMLSAQPWAQAYVTRPLEDLALVLDRATAREVDAVWIDTRLRAAVTEGDRDQVALLSDIAARSEIAVDPALLTALEPVPMAQSVADCAACAYDLSRCPSLVEVMACNLPLELTPLGDVNALRRGAVNWFLEEPVDQFDVALASVGLAATGLVVVSGGTSASVKVGATVLRLGRKLGRVNDTLIRYVVQAGTSPAGLRGLRASVGDLALVQRHTSTVDTIAMLRYVDDGADAARLARVSQAAGPATRAHFEVLGKARVFRAMVRLSGQMLVFFALAVALVLQMLGLLVSLLASRMLRVPRR